ncbi:MAG: zinc-dependent alcohol dehydrogenase family protein [Anaerolineae bacterium]|nr:zinc-dependent alcohol dehydrogenase family protein [Anaerolineae bacterium]
MKAARILEPNQTDVVDVPLPNIGPDDVLIQVKAAGICGTDIHILHGEYMSSYPLIPGHEFSGVVAAVGDSVTRYKVGDRVTADPNIPCNRCSACQRNQPNQCENLAAIGVTRDGAFAEYVTAPEEVVFPIGDLSFAAAALIEPLACVVWGLKRVQIQPGDSVLVIGAGPMGILLAQTVAHAGASQVIVTDTNSDRLALAMSLGATATVLANSQQESTLNELMPGGFDIVADATGIASVLESSIKYVRERGKIWIFGVVPPEETISIVPYDVFRKDLSIIGSFAVCRTFHESIALIQSGTIKVEPLISHKLPITEFAKGLELAQFDPKRMKVQFEL